VIFNEQTNFILIFHKINPETVVIFLYFSRFHDNSIVYLKSAGTKDDISRRTYMHV